MVLRALDLLEPGSGLDDQADLRARLLPDEVVVDRRGEQQ